MGDLLMIFSGMMGLWLLGAFAWWRLGIAEKRERREREAK